MSIPSADPNLSPAQAQSDVQAQEDLTKRIELKNKLCHLLVSSMSQIMKSDVGGSSLVGHCSDNTDNFPTNDDLERTKNKRPAIGKKLLESQGVDTALLNWCLATCTLQLMACN